MHLFATYCIYRYKPAVLEISKSATREHPDSPTIILKQRLRRIIRQPTCLAEDCCLSTLPPGQALVSADPNAPICGCEHGLSGIARQPLLHRNSSDGELSEPVESSRGGDPDIAFTILEKTEDDVAGEAVRSRKYICPAMMYMDEAPLHCADPQTSIAVPEQFVRIDFVVPQQTIRIVRASNRIHFHFVADELHESCAVPGH